MSSVSVILSPSLLTANAFRDSEESSVQVTSNIVSVHSKIKSLVLRLELPDDPQAHS